MQEISATQIEDLAKDSEKRMYNRLLPETFRADPKAKWSIAPFMLHNHYMFEQVEPHIRCVVDKDGEMFAILDISLPAAESVLRWDTTLTVRTLIKRRMTDLDSAFPSRFQKALSESGVSDEAIEGAIMAAMKAA